MTTINLPSVQSLFLEMSVRDQSLATGTGFVVKRHQQNWLITNRHNLAGRRSDTNELLSKTGAVPDTVTIVHNSSAGLGNWQPRQEPLYDALERPLWREHPTHGRAVDVVALPLGQLDGVQIYPHDLTPLPDDQAVSVQVTTELFVVGFPYGILHGGALAIWTRGTVASEYDVDFADLPCYLIDARTRRGQSGSPVVFYNNTGGLVMFRNGDSSLGGAITNQMVGIYSGRVNEESDLGFVWRPQAVLDVIDAGVRPTSN